MAEMQILHEVGEYNLQQPSKLSEQDQKALQETSNRQKPKAQAPAELLNK